ncbi:MAG: peptide chain release factor N(5)-glutamine methyltransferase [Bacteroidota bacterium]
MQLKELKTNFTSELSGLYASEEVQSFFTILSEHFLSYSRLDTVLNAAELISEENCQRFQEALLRLKRFEPVQYVIGQTEFYDLLFKVTPATLIPRPETEELVQWIVDEYETVSEGGPAHFLDVGTGSGCIAIALAKSLAHINMSALDFSKPALEVARHNAQAHQTAVTFFELDILKATSLPRTYDLIVSNPPYVRELEKKMMQPNVLSFEPESALFVSSANPLQFYKKIAQLAKRHLTPGGYLFFEINEYLSKELAELLATIGFSKIEVKKDIFGKERMLSCRWFE